MKKSMRAEKMVAAKEFRTDGNPHCRAAFPPIRRQVRQLAARYTSMT